jgi:hypothetical protein
MFKFRCYDVTPTTSPVLGLTGFVRLMTLLRILGRGGCLRRGRNEPVQASPVATIVLADLVGLLKKADFDQLSNDFAHPWAAATEELCKKSLAGKAGTLAVRMEG